MVQDGEDVKVAVTVTNTGEREGSEVVQVYVTPASSPVPRPARELKGFAKVRLNPGERRRVTITLPDRAFAWFSVERRAWIMEAGAHGIELGCSAAHLPLKDKSKIQAERAWAP